MPPTQLISRGSLVDAQILLQLHDFVPFNLSQALLESFFDFFFKILRNSTFKTFGQPQFWGKNEMSQTPKSAPKVILTAKLYFDMLNIMRQDIFFQLLGIK